MCKFYFLENFNRKKFLIIFLSLILGGLLTGCYKNVTQWERGTTSIQKWAIDKANCHSNSTNMTKEEFKAQRYNHSSDRNAHIKGFNAQMRAYDKIQIHNSFFIKCLKN